MRVLYIEDNLDDIDLMRRKLARTLPECVLDPVTTLREARARLEVTRNYDAALLDVKLPDGSGLDLLAELALAQRPFPIIVLTGSGSEETAVTALKGGATDYVVKRTGYLDQLPTIISDAIKQHQAITSRRSQPLRALYVEHNAADVDLTQRHLARHAPHIQLDVVYDIGAALDKLPIAPTEPADYEAVLIDYRMPGLNALDALKTIRQERRLSLPVLLVTGQGSEEVALQALRLGASDYLVKHPGYLFQLPAALESAHHVNQLQQGQAALRQSEARFRLLAENAQDIIYRIILHPERRYDYVSPSVTAITGYSPEDHYRDPDLSLKLVHPDDVHLLTAVADGEIKFTDPLVLRWIRRDGQIIWTEQRNQPIYNSDGVLVALEGIARDITTQKEAEARLLAKSTELDNYFNMALDLFCITSTGGYFLRLNKEWENALGYPLAELEGQYFMDLVHPDDQASTLAELERLGRQENVLSFTNRYRHKDGSYRWIEWRSIPAGDRIFAAARDITDRLSSDQQLRLHGAALDAAANTILITDVEGIIQWVNPAFTELTHYRPEEAIGHNPRELIKSGEQGKEFYKEMWDTILSGQVWHGELINQRQDGSYYYEEQTITPLRNEAGEISHFVAVKQDITARRQSEQARYLLLALPNAIADAPSLESALEAALSLVCHYADWDLGEVWLPESAPGSNKFETLKLLTQYHQEPELDAVFYNFSQQFHFRSGEGLPGRVWTSQELTWVPEIAEDPNFARANMAVELGFRAAVGIPILLNSTVTAVMIFFSKRHQQEDEHLVSLMSGVAVQLAAAFERKQYEERLHQSQQLAQTTIDGLSAHIAVLDENGEIIAVNQPWLDFGLNNGGPAPLTGAGANYLDVCAAAAATEPDAASMLTGIRAVMRGERNEVTLEYPCDTPQRARWFVARVTPLPGGNPKRRRVVISHEDITTRKQAEESLRETAQHYRLLFDNNPQPMWVYDLETLSFLAVNEAAIEKYGYSLAEFQEMTLRDIRPPEDINQLLAHMTESRPVLQHSGEWRHRLRSGRVIDVEIASHTLNFEGREAALVVAFDITERKQAAAERQAQARRLQQILDTIPEGVVLLEEMGEVTLANPLGQELLLAVSGCQMGERVMEINGRSLKQILKAASGNDSYVFQQDRRYYELLSHPIAPQTAQTVGSDWIMLLRDVTAEHERQQYLETQNRLATVGQLAAGIAHDFNNVMAVIILYSQMLQGMPELSLRALRYLETIINQANHAANMISQILDFSRRSVMERSPLDLLPLLKEMIRLLKNTLPESIEIELLYEPGEFAVMADPTRLQQALMNVAVNARDAMPQGGTLRFALNNLQIATEQDAPLIDMAPGNWLRLSISDNGTGISPEHLPHIFEPFYTTKESGKGTGLGLAQLYGIIKQHEGSIDVQSKLGEGSVFIIYLPMFAVPAPPAAEQTVDVQTFAGSETLLLVEDSPVIRDSIAEALSGLGYQVLQAENGMEAMTLLDEGSHPIDLVLSDVVMPHMDGVALYHAVRAKYPQLKILFMSGYPLQDREGEEFSDLQWVQKPFSLSQLAKKLRTLIESA